MIFYRIFADMNNENIPDEKELSDLCRQNTKAIYSESGEKCIAVINEITGTHCEIAVMVKADAADLFTADTVTDMVSKLYGWQITPSRTEELLFCDFRNLLRSAESHGYINSFKKILSDFNLEPYGYYSHCKEYIARNLSHDEIRDMTKNLLYENSFIPELERIYKQEHTSAKLFHPVHYIIKYDSKEDSREMIDGLISALYENERLLSRRYSETYVFDRRLDEEDLTELYEAHKGGTVVLYVNPKEDRDNPFNTGSIYESMGIAACVVNKFRAEVLSIIVFPCGNHRETNTIYKLVTSPFIELFPENASGNSARQNLEHRANRAEIEVDDKLFGIIKKGKTFCASELNDHFERWHIAKMTAELYPQYAQIQTACAPDTESRSGEALKMLNSMIGLSAAKEIIYKALDFYKVQRMYKQFGKKQETLSMHMVFTGNPGTAKTTTARLFAEILKDNDIITNGKLVEVGRADLIGRYVGHTAPLVKKAFEAAKGGVLFIDEAYSLLDRDSNLYGDEAINTIVQEMENNRDDTIVIFAGYPKEMEEFLNRNPGLKSRIAFHVPFENYSPEELVLIARLMADNKDNVISDNAADKLNGIFQSAAKTENFGNGRFVRNIMEKAEMNRASRIAKMNAAEITEEMLETFTVEDFEYDVPDTAQRQGIGFRKAGQR